MILNLLLLLAGGASCPSSVACLSWNPPATYVAGNPITKPIRYRVFRQAGSDWVLQLETTESRADVAGLALGPQCFRVTAVDVTSGRESAPSDTACKTLRPEAPTDGSIEAPTDGSIEY